MGDLVIKADNNMTLFGFSSISWPSGKTVIFCEFFGLKKLRNTCFLESLHKLAAEQLMGRFAETAIVTYHVSFADQGK
jgi:hypothetical protein